MATTIEGSTMMAGVQHRLTIVQYAGDFREASKRLASGGAENYGYQRYTIEFVEGLVPRLESVATITAFTEERFDVLLPSGARAIGAGFTDRMDGYNLVALVEQTRPNLLILRSPLRPVLKWAIRRKCRTLVLLADSIDPRDLKGRIRWWLLSHYLRRSCFDLVANHGRNASQQLVAAGVDARKVVPWDFPPVDTPYNRSAKLAPSSDGHLIYVGALSEAKGVTDLLAAIRFLSGQGKRLRLSLVGADEEPKIREKIDELGVNNRVTFHGRVAHNRIVTMMEQADIVIVPSRHEYSEGLPLTIYEAFCSRTPIIASDHPMFRGNVVHEESGLTFRAGDSLDLALQIDRLLDSRDLYARLSSGSSLAWEQLQLPVTWGSLINHWLDNGPEARRWLLEHSLLTTAKHV